MAEHYTKSTVEASVWCNKCRKMTPWKIVGGRRQYCTICYDAGTIAAAAVKAGKSEAGKEVQGSLF